MNVATTRKSIVKKKPTKTLTVCLSHKEDADGLSAASLIRQAFGGKTILVDYPGQMQALEEIAANEKLKALYICDLGLNKHTQEKFAHILETLRKKRVSITYIDHHDLDPKIKRRLKAAKVNVIHDTAECATVLVYTAFSKKLNAHAPFIAACAAVTDYMDDRTESSKLLAMYDRQFVLANATALTYNIVGHQKEMDFLLDLVKSLASSKYPHEIKGFFDFAQTQVAKLGTVIALVRKKMKVLTNLAYMEVDDMGASGAVNFVLGLSGKDVGIAYKERIDHGIYAISIRGSSKCKIHLGRLVNHTVDKFDGSGGGHDKACGATVPKEKIGAFIKEMNKNLAKSKT
ncbi:MAG: phosphoesterase DHHA1 [Cenarchaeum symbiont of Oopsacas minuta]|nr:phosphoesterase DHHA1 [Cenarchaeum symbiont of Oopsacas minuta]